METLDSLRPGKTAVILPYQGKKRLLELGFVPGNPVTALFAAPLGDPVAYEICGAVIALRLTDAKTIPISTKGGKSSG